MRHSLFRPLLLLLVVCIGLTACGFQKDSSKMKGKVGDIGEAMEHCRRFMKHLLPAEVFVYIDMASSRETEEYYDIFLDLHDKDQNGHAQCRVDKEGMIIYHAIRNFREKGRSFTSNQHNKQLTAPLARTA